jgi:hypothetical protein
MKRMKQVRLICSLVTLLFLGLSNQIVKADPMQCCASFYDFCVGYCYNLGGVALCNKYVGGCDDECVCWNDFGNPFLTQDNGICGCDPNM